MEEYQTIIREENAEIVEKKSKFIANIYHIENVEEAEEKIKEIKKKYYDSRHNCVAYRVMEDGKLIEKSSDDGEPSGTAGGPMLNILQKNQLCDILVIVTRYFGGILLGTGGLVRAYSDATLKVLEKATRVIKIEGILSEVILDYSNLESFKYYCKNNDINIVKIEYLENIKIIVEIEKNEKSKILDEIETKALKIKEFQIMEEKYINKVVEKNK